MNIDEILTLLPHRYPFLLVDKVIEVVPRQSIKAIKNVSINEPFFNGHFPSKPVMPGVLILEALAQAFGLLMCYSMDAEIRKRSIFYFAALENVKFKRIVIP